jgi:hypothetical protein
MERKDFLKGMCGIGACGCALNFLGAAGALSAEEAAPPDQRLAFARYQVAKLVGFMAADAPKEACIGALEKTGRECAKLTQLHARHKGDLDGYLAAIRQAWCTESSWDKERGVITLAVAEGECGCPMVDTKRTPAAWCSCSVGYQKEAFETVFGRPVKASLKESKLGGSKRCVFEVTLA